MESLTPIELFGAKVDKGWWPLVESIYNRIQELNEAGANIKIDQIKEKQGELCIYVTDAPEEIEDMIMDAKKKSIHICEHCGKPAERVIKSNSRMRTLCPDCLKEQEFRVDAIVKELNRRIRETIEQKNKFKK